MHHRTFVNITNSKAFLHYWVDRTQSSLRSRYHQSNPLSIYQFPCRGLTGRSPRQGANDEIESMGEESEWCPNNVKIDSNFSSVRKFVPDQTAHIVELSEVLSTQWTGSIEWTSLLRYPKGTVNINIFFDRERQSLMSKKSESLLPS